MQVQASEQPFSMSKSWGNNSLIGFDLAAILTTKLMLLSSDFCFLNFSNIMHHADTDGLNKKHNSQLSMQLINDQADIVSLFCSILSIVSYFHKHVSLPLERYEPSSLVSYCSPNPESQLIGNLYR